MITQVQIVGLANGVPCFGNIEVLNMNDKTAYVSWKLFDKKNKTLLASVSRSFFIADKTHSINDIISLAISSILKYRIDRKKIFEMVKIEDAG